ncbi:hypothetical protein Sjap_019366 [Stephania japonica]|uniref:Uncharacterized protein n=1 Tax=Stephania japonica TaxID=461633 RepID=A0AAP0F1G6_9MAGN
MLNSFRLSPTCSFSDLQRSHLTNRFALLLNRSVHLLILLGRVGTTNMKDQMILERRIGHLHKIDSETDCLVEKKLMVHHTGAMIRTLLT